MKRIVKIITASFIAGLIIVLFCSCSAKRPINLKIIDNEKLTEVSSIEGKSVSEVLAEEGIAIHEKDEITPSFESKVTQGSEIYIKRYAKVKICVDGEETEVELVGSTVKQAIEKAGIEIKEKDIIDCDEDAFLIDGMTINIKKGKTIYITVSGEKKKRTVYADTVKRALKECKISYDNDDIITPSLKKKVSQKMTIVVKNVEIKEEKILQTIYFKTENQYSSSMNKGTSKVETEGVNGQKEIIYERKYIDGELSESNLISEKTISSPVNKVVIYGTKEVTTSKSETTTKSETKANTAASTTSGKTIVSKEAVYDCDGSEHGYYIITYSDGSVVYQDF